MNEFFKFDKMITTSIIKVVWWVSSAICFIVGYFMIVNSLNSYGNEGTVILGLIIGLGGPFVSRIYCELLIVLFKINDNIQDIRNETTKSSRKDIA